MSLCQLGGKYRLFPALAKGIFLSKLSSTCWSGEHHRAFGHCLSPLFLGLSERSVPLQTRAGVRYLSISVSLFSVRAASGNVFLAWAVAAKTQLVLILQVIWGKVLFCFPWIIWGILYNHNLQTSLRRERILEPFFLAFFLSEFKYKSIIFSPPWWISIYLLYLKKT